METHVPRDFKVSREGLERTSKISAKEGIVTESQANNLFEIAINLSKK